MASAQNLSVGHTNQGIQEIYDEAASYYQQLRWFKTRLTRLEYAQTEDALLTQFGFVPENKGRYLEIGCGPGTWTKVVAAHAAEVVALDISENMIEQARKYVGADNVTFVHGDAAHYQPEGRLDGFFSFRVIEYIDGWQETLTRVAAHVPSGGRAVVCTKTPLSVYRGTGRERWFTARPHRALDRLRRRLRGEPEPLADDRFWQRYVSPSALRHVLAQAGFTDFQLAPAIYGLPIFWRGTCQYPLVPEFAEPAFMSAFEQGRKLSNRLPAGVREPSLVFSESYVLSATKR